MLKQYATLKPYIKEHWHRYAMGILFLALTNGGQMAIPQVMKEAVNLISRGDTSTQTIGRLMLIMGGFALLVALGRIGWRHFIHGASRRIERDLRGRLFSHLLTLSRDFYSQNKTGDLMARATNDMKNIRQATGMALVAFLDGLFMTLFILVILFKSYPRLTPILILPLPLLTVAILVMGPMVGKLFRRVQKAYSGISHRAQEGLAGIGLIKTFQREGYALDRFQEQNEQYVQANLGLVRIWGMFHPLILFFSGIISFLLLRYGGAMVLTGELEPGDFVAALSYMGMLIWPMIGAGFTINSLQRGAVSLERINKILEERPQIHDPENPQEVQAGGDIILKNVSFRYEESQSDQLQNIDLQIPRGTTLGIMGPTGSGKSTLVDIITRQREPREGTVRLGGQELKDYSLEELRRAFAMVPQESFLFSRSLKDNLLFGAPQASEEELIQALADSAMDKELEALPKGIDTQVGERGVTLSGGQKQRSALARALLTQREILVLDDSLSAVDTRTEETIQDALARDRQGRTNIIISHRYSSLKDAQQIIVLDQGRITQRGTHEELIEQEGFYRDIYRLQRLEEK